MKIQLFPDIMAALRRGEIPMQQITWSPHPDHPTMTVWIEVLSAETARVAECSRRDCPREYRAYLDRLDIELASASIEVMGTMPSPSRPPAVHRRRQRAHFAPKE